MSATTSNLGEWEALAEIHLNHNLPEATTTSTSITPTYCLCSRVFIKNYYDVYASTLEKDEEVSDTEEQLVDATTPEPCPTKQQQQDSDNHVHFSVVSASELIDPEAAPKRQDDADNDANSCYYSASASHTDNYCSTDEHEHHAVQKQQNIVSKKRPAFVAERLHSSDSGADISENHLLDKMRWHTNGTLIEGSAEDDEEAHEAMTTQPPPVATTIIAINTFSPPQLIAHERNNSLPNILCPEELAAEWECYWNRHGEQLIWSSWIEKYSDFIDPAFNEEEDAKKVHQMDSKDTDESPQEAAFAAVFDCSTANTLNEKNIFTFDDEDIDGLQDATATPSNPVSAEDRPKTEIVVSNCSPGGRNDGQEVPTNEDPWTSYRNRLSVDERLLSPRCDSVNSCTIGGAATDSMTNVTRMTISSCEFCSSKVTSESSQNSMNTSTSSSSSSSSSPEDFISSTPHSITHSSQFYETIDQKTIQPKLDPGAPIVALQQTAEDAMDVDQYWQVLWEKHFQEQYARHYKDFTVEQQLRIDDRVNVLSGSLKSEAIFEQCVHGGRRTSSSKAQSRRSRSVKRLRKSANECLPKLVANLRIKNEQQKHKQVVDSEIEVNVAADDGKVETSEAKEAVEEENNQQVDETSETNAESNLMAAYGLPRAFGSSSARKVKGGDGDDDEDKDKPPRRATNLKRGHESDSEELNRDRIKDAFSLMGFAYENPPNGGENEEKGVTGNASGEVVYRKKHIRLHNRALKMKIQQRPKLHIRFDEDGNAIGAEGSADGVLMEGGIGGGADENATTSADPVLLHSSSDDDSQGGAHHQRTATMAASAANWIAAQQQASQSVEQMPEEISDDEMQGVGVTTKEKKKKRKRKGKITALLPPEIANDKTLMKYWYKRFSLFQLFDQGIRMDRESWFSVTPEKVAAHAAERCRCDLIVDGFCGVGGNAIQFAFTCLKVIAIDIDPKKIEMAKHNANIYGVADRIEFIVGDFFQLAERLKSDVVFLSPPWGGPKYMKVDTYDLETHLQPVAASVMMEKARQVSENVAIFIPRNSNTQQLTTLAGPGGRVEIEQSFLDRKLIALTAYYGELINE